MRRLNLRFATALVLFISLLAGSVDVAHVIQVSRLAPALLEHARRVEADGDLGRAEELLRQYLMLRREDGPTWARYARIVDRREVGRRGRQRAYRVHAVAFRHDRDDAVRSRDNAPSSPSSSADWPTPSST